MGEEGSWSLTYRMQSGGTSGSYIPSHLSIGSTVPPTEASRLLLSLSKAIPRHTTAHSPHPPILAHPFSFRLLPSPTPSPPRATPFPFHSPPSVLHSPRNHSNPLFPSNPRPPAHSRTNTPIHGPQRENPLTHDLDPPFRHHALQPACEYPYSGFGKLRGEGEELLLGWWGAQSRPRCRACDCGLD